MFTLDEATSAVMDYLRATERQMNTYGSALPGHENSPKLHLIVTQVKSENFGWVFSYDSQEHQETGDFRFCLAGNAPLIFDRYDGGLYVTGTAYEIEYYLKQYRDGIRIPATGKR